LKKFLILVCCLLIAFATANISLAHPGGTDENGGHYDNSSGEYHYHHGESAHQHPNGVCPYTSNDSTDDEEKRYALAWFYVDVDNLEDVIFNEFEGEEGEEIRDVLVFNPDCEILEIGLTKYIEYESLRDVAMNEYGEEIEDKITANPDLIILTSEDIIDRHDLKEYEEETEDNVTEHTEESEYNSKKEEKSTLAQVIEGVIDFCKEFGIAFGILLCVGALILAEDYFKNRKK
jgi:hypothetical protein